MEVGKPVASICHGQQILSAAGALKAEKVFNQDLYFKKTVKYVGEPMSHLESIASSAVRAAIKVKASIIICFTSSGRAARLIAKYRPTMPVLSVVIPRLKTNQLKWSFSGAFEARQSLIVRGLFPMLADPRHPWGKWSWENRNSKNCNAILGCSWWWQWWGRKQNPSDKLHSGSIWECKNIQE